MLRPPSAIASATLLEAQLVVRHHGCAVSECLTDGAYAAQISADRDGDVIVMTGPTPEHVERFVQNVRATQKEEPRILMRSPTGVVVRGRDPEWGVVATINRSGCTILWPSVWSDGREKYAVLAGNRAQLDALVAALRPMGEVTLERVSDVSIAALTVHTSIGTLTDGLTPKQLHALELAVRAGYYDSPRRTDTRSMADSVGISRSTFEEHLRKAERRAMNRYVEAVAAHSPLQHATGKRGRPPRRTDTRIAEI